MKKIFAVLALALFTATAVFAAEGKVVSVADGQAVVEVDGAKFKAGGKVKLNGKTGKVTAVDGNKLTIQAPGVDALNAGDSVKVDKAAAALQGC